MHKAFAHGSRPFLVAFVVSVSFVISGCGGQEDGTGSGEAGGGVIVGYDQEPPSLNPYTGDAVAISDMVAGVLETPLEMQPDLSFAPGLAEAAPEVVGEDPFTIEYRLREGLTWSDGEPLTSEDARFTYEQIMDEENNIISREGWELVEEFETPDERTVRIGFSETYANWRTLLANDPILPRHVYEGEDFNTALDEEVVGSGPFAVEEWDHGQSLTLSRNENYWGEEPGLGEITFRFIPDTNTLISSLESGEVAFVNPPPDIGLTERLEGISGAEVESAAGTVWEHIAFNVEEVESFELRQAVAYGIDRGQIVDELLQGEVAPLQSVLVPEQEQFYAPAWEQYDHDPELARELVEAAEGEGVEPEITFSTTAGNQLRESLQEVVQQQLGEVGIEVSIDNAAAATFVDDLNSGNYEMAEFSWFQTPEPDITSLFSGNTFPPDGQNVYRYSNEEVTELLEQSDGTVEEDERAELFVQAQEEMAGDLPLIPLFQSPITYAHDTNLQGPEVNPTLAGPFWNLGEWESSG